VRRRRDTTAPILFADVDGVVSLFGWPADRPPPGRFHWVDGIAHWIGADCGPRLCRLTERFELVWATGWEHKANEYLPFLLSLPKREYPVLEFGRAAVFGSAHWKLGPIEAYAGERPAAWIDDCLDEECRAWAASRRAPTLLVETEPAHGITDEHVDLLLAWAGDVVAAGG
jgi:hypothetical protein